MEKIYLKYKWIVWLLLTTSLIFMMFLRMSTGVISSNLSDELGFSTIQISNIASFTIYSYAIMQIPAGILVDKYGPRHVSSIGMILAGLGSILFGLTSNLLIIYISRIIVGLGTSVLLVSILKIQANWFNVEEFSSLSAKRSFIANTGSIFATFPLAFLVSYIGWRNSFYIIGMGSILVGIAIYIIVRNKPKENNSNTNFDESEKVFIKEALREVIKNKATWYNFFIMFVLAGTTTALSSLWGMRYIIDVYKVKDSVAAFIVPFISYGIISGAFIMNLTSKHIKINPIKIAQLAGFIYLVIWTIIVVVYKVKPPIIILPIAFFIIGFASITHLFTFTDIKEKTTLKYCGVAMSIVNLSEFVGVGVINLYIGYVFENINVNVIDLYRISFTVFIWMSIIAIIAGQIGSKK